MIEIKISYDPDPDLALENTRFWAPLSLTAEQKHSVHSSVEMERLADELPIDQVAQRWIIASDPDEAVAEYDEYQELLRSSVGGPTSGFEGAFGLEGLLPPVPAWPVLRRRPAERVPVAAPGLRVARHPRRLVSGGTAPGAVR